VIRALLLNVEEELNAKWSLRTGVAVVMAGSEAFLRGVADG